MKTWWLLTLVIGIFSAEGQTKKWDGEGGDSLWNNEKNWYPDGIPVSTDKIELDHSRLSSAYTIKLPSGNVTVEAKSITIEGAEHDSINLVIPESNTISPALVLNDPNVSISIKKAGILTNRSGAASGNTFQFAGSIRIENGGTYLHQTIRGTAAIAAKLVVDNNCSLGKFIVDVPGTAGYILSLSGRKYGTLILRADGSGGKRSYSGSGNSPLQIQGDIHVLKGVSLITTLNGNIEIQGSLFNDGNIQLNPTSTDTIAKSIIFQGEQSTLTNTGVFNCNLNMRKISIDSNASLELKTDFHVWQEKLIFELNGKLICNSYFIGGMGKFISNYNGWISSTSPIVLSSNSNEGNFRNVQVSIHKKTRFSFLGEDMQHTGNAFPDSISILQMNKKSGMLILDKPLYVSDSLFLMKGILKSDDQRLLSCGGTSIQSRNPSSTSDTTCTGYISGLLRFYSNTNDSILVPLGNDTNFSPCLLKCTTNNAYQISYDEDNHLQKISLKYNQKTSSHWHVQKITQNDTTTKNETISLYLGNISMNQTEQPVVIFNNTTDSNWISKPVVPFRKMDIFLQTQPINLQDGVYMLATQFIDALSLERIDLFKNEINGVKGLKWQVALDAAPLQFIVEKSFNGITYQPMVIKPGQINQNRNEYQMALLPQDASGYFRVIARVGDRKIISNIIHIENPTSIKVFPNPAFDKLYIQLEHRYQNNAFELMDMLGRKYAPQIQWEDSTACIDISQLPTGIYFVMLHEGATKTTWRFLKTD